MSPDTASVHEVRPSDWREPALEIVGCFFEHEGKHLLLLRQDAKPQGGTWGLPAGQVEKGESNLAAMGRELEEETGYSALSDELKFWKTLFVRFPEFDFSYHLFSLQLVQPHEVKLNELQHKDFKWVTPVDSFEVNLIPGQAECSMLFYSL